MTDCTHKGHYDYRDSDCAGCHAAPECVKQTALCYGRAYSWREKAACKKCPLAEYCMEAEDPHFWRNRHGEPSITAMDNIEILELVKDTAPFPNGLSLAMLTLWEDCGHDALLIAAAVARHGGATLTEIGQMLGGYPKQWVSWFLHKIKNPVLRDYLLRKQTGKYFMTPIREECRKNSVRKRGSHNMKPKSADENKPETPAALDKQPGT